MVDPFAISDTIPLLPECGEYAMVAMRYKNVELAFCVKPEDMGVRFDPCVQQLRKAVIELAGDAK